MTQIEKSSPGDEDLRSRFASLRRVDCDRAPEFDALVGQSGIPKPSAVALRAAALAAAAIVAFVGVRFAVHQSRIDRTPASAPVTAQSILTWRSPTASLLRTPGRELLRTTPALRSSLLREPAFDSLLSHHPGA